MAKKTPTLLSQSVTKINKKKREINPIFSASATSRVADALDGFT